MSELNVWESSESAIDSVEDDEDHCRALYTPRVTIQNDAAKRQNLRIVE
jgi:hypothetical protein